MADPTAEPGPHPTGDVVAWLMEGDPAIRWQTRRDLLDDDPATVERERSAVAESGWGARLLALQDPEGTWDRGWYTPKWTSTTYTLLLLQRLGLPEGHPEARRATGLLWGAATRFGGGLTLSRSIRAPETCITAMLVLLASSYGGPDADEVDTTVDWLLSQQLPDGGWNCRTLRDGSVHGSFHTSILVLEGLLDYQRTGGRIDVGAALAGGGRFFLDHHLDRSHRTGEVVDPAFGRFPFPPQWHFDVLRGLEHFREAGAAPDPRLADAVARLEERRGADGRWPAYRGYAGRQWFVLEPPGPGRWTTLRALRVLRWWRERPG